MEFKPFQLAVSAQFVRLSKNSPFRVNIDHGEQLEAVLDATGDNIIEGKSGKDKLWELYLASFPEGTNPMFRKRTEHDCSCCRSFVRAIGNMVAYIDGKLESIWDVKVPEEPCFEVVAQALSAFVKSKPVHDKFLSGEKSVGTARSLEMFEGKPIQWNHFHVNVPTELVQNASDIASNLGLIRSKKDVFLRGLEELSLASATTMLELIASNSLYRGSEAKAPIENFVKHKKAYDLLSDSMAKEMYAWKESMRDTFYPIRNTAAGTFLKDYDEGKMDLDDICDKFGRTMDPTNFKRPKTVVTKKMIEEAKATISGLGLMSALERRYATLGDITVNNIIFADRTAKPKMGGNVFDTLSDSTSAKVDSKALDKIETVSIDKFLADIVPKAESIEVLLENHHASNMASLVAPVDPSAGKLFKWDNSFSWSYTGDVADSIKERVKKAGGNVTGELCCRLSWTNTDDLDLHMIEPGGKEINFHVRSSHSGGKLDIDMNNGFQGELSRNAVENIYYESMKFMPEGKYTLYVNNYRARETKDVGFTVEIDCRGDVQTFHYPQAVGNGANVIVAEMTYSKKDGLVFVRGLPSNKATRTIWGLPSQTFHKVNVLMHSPNYWDGQKDTSGNKHFFFMLNGAINEGEARGFFNEFLRGDLDKHRKVFEVVGSKMKTEKDPNQLSGIGISSTKKETLTVRVKGAITRTLNVQFGV